VAADHALLPLSEPRGIGDIWEDFLRWPGNIDAGYDWCHFVLFSRISRRDSTLNKSVSTFWPGYPIAPSSPLCADCPRFTRSAHGSGVVYGDGLAGCLLGREPGYQAGAGHARGGEDKDQIEMHRMVAVQLEPARGEDDPLGDNRDVAGERDLGGQV